MKRQGCHCIRKSRSGKPLALYLMGLLIYVLTGCGPHQGASVPPVAKAPAPASPFNVPAFVDSTAKAGLIWTHNPCRTGKKLLPETVGGGGGFIDYNNDGLLDILLINGAPLPGYKGPTPHLALYRNNGDGTFTDVTRQSGLDFKGYGLGAAVGDYDNDGWADLYITAVGGNRLYHNDHGHFRDVTAQAGVGIKGFSTGAAWIDYDHDGKLDLFVANYVEWSPQTDLACGTGSTRLYCPPNQYQGARPALFRNRGNGAFENVTQKSGILGHSSKTLAVLVYDFNGDGWPDLFLANDTEPNVLLINNRDGTFTDQALAAGVAVSTDGSPTGSMGVDVATPFRDGRVSIAVGTFAGQEMSLYTTPDTAQTDRQGAPGPLMFDNLKSASKVAEATRTATTFGLAFMDADLDGWPDIVVANGHIDDDPSLHVAQNAIPYRQKPQLFQNQRDGTFKEIGTQAGFTAEFIGRGLAVGDYDNDGRPDLLIFENGGPVHLYHNETKPVGNWLGVTLIGARSPRDGSGAMVTLSGPGWSQTRCASTARSYLSICDPRVHFGVGRDPVSQLTVRWPSGMTTTLKSPALNRYLTVRETPTGS